jgi:hypothetical protein
MCFGSLLHIIRLIEDSERISHHATKVVQKKDATNDGLSKCWNNILAVVGKSYKYI